MELKEARQGLEVAWSEMEALQEEVAKRDALLARFKAAVVQQREDTGALEATVQEQQRRIEKLEADLEEAGKEREVKRGPTRAEEKKIETLRRQVDDLTDQLRDRESQVRKLESEKRSDASEAEDAKRDLARAEGKVDVLEKQLGKMSRELEDQEAMVAEKQKEVRDLREVLAARDAARDAARSSRVMDQSLPDIDEASQAVMVAEPPPRRMTKPLPEPARKPAPVPTDPADEALKQIVAGNKALRAGDIAEAEELFNRALAGNPDLVGARMGLAACYYSRSKLDEAKFILDQLLSEDRNDAQALGLSGIIAWQEGDIRKASKQLERAVKIDSNDAQLQNFLGIVEHARGKQDRAIDALRRAVELDPQHTEAMFNLAVLLTTATPPQLEEARVVYKRALDLGSDRDDQLEKMLNL
jgi:Flp pilus assembly protein TadD